MIKYLFTFLINASSFVLQAKNDFYGIIAKNGMKLPDSVLLLNEDSVVVNLPDLLDRPTILSFVLLAAPGTMHE